MPPPTAHEPGFAFSTRSRLLGATVVATALTLEQATRVRSLLSESPSWLDPTRLAFVVACLALMLGTFVALELVRGSVYGRVSNEKTRRLVSAGEGFAVGAFGFGVEPFRVFDGNHGVLVIALAAGIGVMLHGALARRAPRATAALLIGYVVFLFGLRRGFGSVHYVSEHTAMVLTMLFCAARAAELIRPSLPLARALEPAFVVVGLVLAHGVLVSSSATRGAFYVDATLGRAALRPIALLLDVDRDGGVQGFGSVDCDVFSAARGPFAEDVPDDGIDQDCDGRDARTASVARLARGRTEPLPDIYLLSADGLRWDVGARLTRTASALRDRAIFTHAVAPSPRTMNSFASVLRGRTMGQLPFAHATLRSSLRPNVLPTIGDVLGRHGYRAVYVPPHEYLAPATSIVTGFEEARPVASQEGHAEGPSGRAALDALLAAARATDGPLLAMAHLMETHTPYRAVDGSVLGTDLAAYRLSVDGVDALLARFVSEARALGVARGRAAWFVVYGDHGEAFREHGDVNHSTSLFAEQVRVVFWIAGTGTGARHIDAPVSSSALPATLLDLLGLAPEPSFTVASLGPCIVRGEACPTSATSDLYVVQLPSDVALRGHTTGTHRVIVDRAHDTARIFDLVRDPYERHARAADTRGAMHLLDAMTR